MDHCINDYCEHCKAKFEKCELTLGNFHVDGFYKPYCELGHHVQSVDDKSFRPCADYQRSDYKLSET